MLDVAEGLELPQELGVEAHRSFLVLRSKLSRGLEVASEGFPKPIRRPLPFEKETVALSRIGREIIERFVRGRTGN